MTIFVDHYRKSWSGASTTQAISSVGDVTRAFVVGHGDTSNVASPRSTHWLHRFTLTSTTQVTITRELASGAGGETSFLVIYCDEQEFLTEAIDFTITTGNSQLDSALARTFNTVRSIIVGVGTIPAAGTTATDERYAFVTPELISSGASCRIKRGGTPAFATRFVGWAIEFSRRTGVLVETGEDSLSGDMGTAAISFSNVAGISLPHTLSFFLFRHESNGIEQMAVEAWITEASRFYRRHTDTSNFQSYARYWLVRFPSTMNLVVSRASASTAANTDLLVDVDSPRAFLSAGEDCLIFHQNSCSGIGTGWARPWWVLTSFVDTDTVRLQRWRDTADCRFRLMFADFQKFKLNHGAHLALGMCA